MKIIFALLIGISLNMINENWFHVSTVVLYIAAIMQLLEEYEEKYKSP